MNDDDNGNDKSILWSSGRIKYIKFVFHIQILKKLNLSEREMWNDLAYRKMLLFHKIKKELRRTKREFEYFHKHKRLWIHDFL